MRITKNRSVSGSYNILNKTILIFSLIMLGTLFVPNLLCPNYSFGSSLGALKACAQASDEQNAETKKDDIQQVRKIEVSLTGIGVDSELSTLLKEYLDKKGGKQAIWPIILPSIPAVFSILVSGFITLVVFRQNIKLEKLRNDFACSREIILLEANTKRDLSLEATRTKLRTAREKLALERRRLESFYAPLLALFRQSRGVADKLCQYFYDKSRACPKVT